MVMVSPPEVQLQHDAGSVSALQRLASSYSIELTAGVIRKNWDVVCRLQRGTTVFLPYLPGTKFSDNVDVAGDLVGIGLKPVPHVSARALTSRDEVVDGLAQYTHAGAQGVLLVAGDPAEPGPFSDTIALLRSGVLDDVDVTDLYVAGHPGGHQHADEAALFEALRYKVNFANERRLTLTLVTQFSFESEPVIAWQSRLQRAGFDVPIRAGLPGPTSIPKLISFALSCGVATSMAALTKRPDALKLLGKWSPEPLLREFASHVASSEDLEGAALTCPLQGLHFFPFGGAKGTVDLLEKLAT